VTPQAALFLEKARKLLVEADTMLSVNLNEAAGRTAYLAGFHVAEALIFERLGKVLKTHNGVQTATMANHTLTCTTQFYDRRHNAGSLEEVERVVHEHRVRAERVGSLRY
jgi:uncharacterized protein (UPF0332 family)